VRAHPLPGVVFTPPWLAEKVVDRLTPGLPVVDLGAGTGMLALAAAKRGFDVVAVESDPELASVLEAVAGLLRLRGRIEVRIENALSYTRSSPAQIMSNPPFTRHQSLSGRLKRTLGKQAGDLGIPLLGSSGYYAYFMVFGWTAPWSKREVFLLPTNWLEAKYGAALRTALQTRNHSVEVVENGRHVPVFSGALTTVCLVTSWPDEKGRLTIPSPSLRGSQTTVAQTLAPLLSVTALSGPNGSAPAAPSVIPRPIPTRHSVPGTGEADRTLGEFLAVHRGIATGMNDFFVLTRLRARDLGLPASELTPVLRRFPRRGARPDIELLWTPGRPPSRASSNLIARGARSGVRDGYLCSHRKPWWRLDLNDPPDYLLPYIGRDEPEFIANRWGVRILNNTHGLSVREAVPERKARAVARWLASAPGRAALSQRARHYFGGMWKLEPREVARMPLPDELVRALA
jgi:adenine-specific DNA-methyltransferase